VATFVTVKSGSITNTDACAGVGVVVLPRTSVAGPVVTVLTTRLSTTMSSVSVVVQVYSMTSPLVPGSSGLFGSAGIGGSSTSVGSRSTSQRLKVMFALGHLSSDSTGVAKPLRRKAVAPVFSIR